MFYNLKKLQSGVLGNDAFAGEVFEFLLKLLCGAVVQGVRDSDAIVAENVSAAAARCSLYGHDLVVLDCLCWPEPEALRDCGGGEGDGAGHLYDDDDNCREKEKGDPQWNRISMCGYRGVEEEKNKGGQKNGARPRDHWLDGEGKTFLGLTCRTCGEAAAKGDKQDDTESDGAKQLRVDMHRSSLL
jgi:hypothetical protein